MHVTNFIFSSTKTQERLLGLIVAILVIPCIISFVASPVTYDTLHLIDTLYITEIGWRMHLGYTPGTDFGSMYGSTIGHYISLAFTIFGVSIKSLDYAVAIQYLTLVALLGSVAYKRLAVSTFLLLLLTVSSVLFARLPLEEYPTLLRLESAHSFSYNRFATGIMVIFMSFALVRAQTTKVEIYASVMVGLFCSLLLLTKSTFIIFIVGLLISIAFQRQWAILLIMTLTVMVATLIQDPSGIQALNTFRYAVELNFVSNQNYWWLITKPMWIVLSQLWAFALTGLVYFLFLSSKSKTNAWAVSALLISAMMTAVTMGAQGLSGFHAVPLLAGIVIAVSASIQDGSSKETTIVKALALLIVITTAVGLTTSSVLINLKAAKNAHQSNFTTGPLRGYWAHSKGLTNADPTLTDLIKRAQSHLNNGGKVNIEVEYAQLVDAYRTLSTHPNIRQLKVVSDTPLNFSFALQTMPALTYPMWLRTSSPELKEMVALPNDASVLLLARKSSQPGAPFHKTNQHLGVSDIIKLKMADDYMHCRSTDLWQIYVRHNIVSTWCTAI